MSALNKRLQDGIEALKQGELERAEDLLDEVAVSPGGDTPIAGLEAEAEARFYKLLSGVAQRKKDIGLALSAFERQRALEDEAGVRLDDEDDFDEDEDEDFDDEDEGFSDEDFSDEDFSDEDFSDEDADEDGWEAASFEDEVAAEVHEAPAAEAPHAECACQRHAHAEPEPVSALALAQAPTPVVMSGPDDSVRQTWMRYQKGDTAAEVERTTTQTFESGAWQDDEAAYYADRVTTTGVSSTHIIVGEGDALPEDVEAALGVEVNGPGRAWDECRIEEVRMLRTTLIYREPHAGRHREIQE